MESHFASAVQESLLESLEHAGLMLPVLFAVFLLMEAINHSAKTTKLAGVARHAVLGPIVAAVLGLLPQCGFSVAATTLFLEGVIPTGSLLAVYIATSDEAVPILIGNPNTLPWVLPLLATKLVWGSIVGTAVNLGLRKHASLKETRKRTQKVEVHEGRPHSEGCRQPDGYHHPEGSLHSEGCRQPDGHHHPEGSLHLEGCHHPKLCHHPAHNGWKDYLGHAAVRSMRVGALVFVLSSILHLVGHVFSDRIELALGQGGLIQPLAASFIGLVPSCATSVVMAEAFRAGLMSFPAIVSGLTSNAGIGLLVLIKENRQPGQSLSIIAMLVASAALVGLLAYFLV